MECSELPNVLDVGCGRHKHGNIGIDYSKESDADIIADAHFLPFQESCFDKAVSFSVLEHSPNPLDFLREQHRVLKPNGQIEVTTDNAQFYLWSVMKLRGLRHESYHATDHYMVFNPEHVLRLFKLAKFRTKNWEFVSRRRRKMDVILTLLIKIGIIRPESYYQMFNVIAVR